MIARAADVIIIGSGAGGSAAAYALSSAGFDVLVLEKGPRYERTDFVHDEIEIRGAGGIFVPPLRDDPHVIVEHGSGRPTPRLATDGWTASCVGGGTNHMGATLQRLHPDDFRLRTRCGEFHDLVDWPYTYADLEPFYSSAEWLLGVSGDAENFPAEMFRSRAYPMPPLASHALADRFDAVCRGRDLRPIKTPRGINSRPYDGRPACEHCDLCSGAGCPTGARGSAQETLLRRAEQTGRCSIVPNAMVTRLVAGRDRRLSGVQYVDDAGREHRIPGRLLCVSCGAVESARLLLLSASAAAPNGIANANGLVGRALQFNASSSGWAAFDRADDDHGAGQGARFMDRGLMDYYFHATPGSALPKGGFLSFHLAQPQPLVMADEIATGLGSGSVRDLVWGRELKERLRNSVATAFNVTFELFHDGFANDDTYVELDPDVRDRWGLPSARINYRALDHYAAVGGALVDTGLDILREMGAGTVARRSVGTRNPYLAKGTCRAGTDPRTSVLNAFCQSHDHPNLFVIDSSFMPSCGGAPSTLTIVANGLRASEYIVDRARTGDV